MAVTVLTSGVRNSIASLTGLKPDPVNAGLTIIMMLLAIIVSIDCCSKWIQALRCPHCPISETEPKGDLMGLAQGIEIKE